MSTATASSTTYQELTDLWKNAGLLGSCKSVLGWDEQTYMPDGGSKHRSQQLALLAGLTHERRTNPKIGDLLNALKTDPPSDDPLSPESVNVREIRWLYDRATKLPKSLVEEEAKVTSQAQHHWIKARKDDNFKAFEPWLEKVIELKKQTAEAYGYEEDPYDALLEDYEPGMKSSQLDTLFSTLREHLVPLVAKIGDSSTKPKTEIIERDYPVEKQRFFAESTAAAIGFDFHRGRLDTTAHPFCSGFGPGDVRITTRFNPRFFNEAFFGVMHEAGHGMYEQGLDPEYYGTPMGDAVSLGVHESQSRLWENEVARSFAFWKAFFPRAQQTFTATLHDVKMEDFHFAVNAVEPSLIRVEADEVTYNLHILIRFEMERALLSGQLKAADVPTAWNEKYQNYLGITPPDFKTGCLQDIHWSAGLMGYFPTYSLGNVYGAQLFNAANNELGDLNEQFAQAKFCPLKQWLNQKVHEQGQRYRSHDLIKAVTGEDPCPHPLIESLKAKFSALYNL